MRINVIPVCELTDQHLVAEYREIKMLPKALIKTIKSKKGFSKDRVPEKYTLGKGHGYFFYDKLKFIDNRFDELLDEMKKRGFETKSNKLYYDDFDYSLVAASPGYFNNYTPTKEDIELNRQRIKDRINEVKNFYRYYGKLIKGEKDMKKVHLCKSCSETKNCDWYNAAPGVGMYECENYVEKLDFSKHICDVCKTVDEKCPRGLKRDDRDIVVTQCSFFDEYKDSVGDCTTNFSSRFMPNVKFKTDTGNNKQNRDIELFFSKNVDVINDMICDVNDYMFTSDDGKFLIMCDSLFYANQTHIKEVSIYEAIPELVPEDMRYNKELDKLVPDVLEPVRLNLGDYVKKNKNGEWINCTSSESTGIVAKNDNLNGIKILTHRDARYCDGISLENSIGEVATNFFENKYDRKIIGKDGRECVVDVYDVLKAFEVKCPALQHLIKKALCAGLRGHKDIGTDLQDIIDSAARAKELYGKDQNDN